MWRKEGRGPRADRAGHLDQTEALDMAWLRPRRGLPALRMKLDPALAQLAVIVRGADTARLDLAPQAAGLLALSLGLSHNFPDDHEMLGHGMVIYDALYAWCRTGQSEAHGWPPKTP